MMEMHLQTKTAKKNSTTSNIAYLLLSFPLGLCYFILIVTGLALGVSTLVIWIGLPILFVTLLMVRGMVVIEQRIAASLLHVSFPYGTMREIPQQSLTRRFISMLRDPSTWTGMVYMILKLPLGIASFTLALTLPIVSLVVTALPLAYLINLLVNVILLQNGIDSTGFIIPGFIVVHGQFDPIMFARSFVGVPVGLALWFMTRTLLNGLAVVSGEIARALLSPGTAAMTRQSQQFYTAPMAQEQSQMYGSRERV